MYVYRIDKLFCCYLSLEKNVVLHLNKLESLSNEMICAKFGEIYPLHGSEGNVEYVRNLHFIDRQTDGKTDHSQAQAT